MILIMPQQLTHRVHNDLGGRGAAGRLDVHPVGVRGQGEQVLLLRLHPHVGEDLAAAQVGTAAAAGVGGQEVAVGGLLVVGGGGQVGPHVGQLVAQADVAAVRLLAAVIAEILRLLDWGRCAAETW